MLCILSSILYLLSIDVFVPSLNRYRIAFYVEALYDDDHFLSNNLSSQTYKTLIGLLLHSAAKATASFYLQMGTTYQKQTDKATADNDYDSLAVYVCILAILI